MENWRRVWREGLAPLISIEGLKALKSALSKDDHRLVQGATTFPPPFQFVGNSPVKAACAIGFCGWRGDGLETVAKVGIYFKRICLQAKERMIYAEVDDFLDWFDETPRKEMRELLEEEVDRSIGERHAIR